MGLDRPEFGKEYGNGPTHFFTGPKVANRLRINDFVRNRPGAAPEIAPATEPRPANATDEPVEKL